MPQNKKYLSQYGQDKIADILLRKKTNGFFIDIGAHDGISYSNSYFFENERKYKGICFEPIPAVFQKLVNNRKCDCINGAVCEKNELVTFTLCTDYAEMLSGITEYREPEMIDRTMKDISRNGGSISEIKVQGYNLNNILKSKNIVAIDFLSLDIEGGELFVLKTIDFKSLDIKVLSIELNFPETEKQIRNYLEENNFRFLFRIDADGIFINNNHFNKFDKNVLRLIVARKLTSFKLRVFYRIRIILGLNK